MKSWFIDKLKSTGIDRDLWLSLAAVAVVVCAGLYLGWDNNRVITPMPEAHGFHYTAERHNPLSFFSEWDSPDYLQIAKDGYTNDFWVNWFPFYPITINLVHRIIPSALDSALIIAWTSLVAAVYAYIKIVRRIFKIDNTYEPLRALIFFLLFPTGVFLIAPFSESLYAALALGAIYFALEKRWKPAALLLLLCTATHITGPLVVILVALILLEENVPRHTVAFTVAIGSLGLVTYMSYLYDRFGRPFAFLESQQIYHHWTSYGILNLIVTATPSRVLSLILVIAAGVYWWNRRRSFAIYSWLFLAIPIFGRQYGGFNRYVLMAFPIMWMFYGWLRHKSTIFPYAAAILGILWTYFLLQYAAGYIGS